MPCYGCVSRFIVQLKCSGRGYARAAFANKSYSCTAKERMGSEHRFVKDIDSYLNDHLAGSVSALEMLSHWAHLHKGTTLGAFFTATEAEIKADQDTLRDVMRSLGIGESTVRKTGAWAAEKVGRARLMVAGDEPDSLGLVLTLEGLIMGVTGKKLMWRAVAAANLPQLKGYNFEELLHRAEQQIETLEAEHIEAARRAFTDANREE